MKGVRTDFTVAKSKPVKTKLVIQRNLGDVLFDPEEIKRAKKEKMKEYIRLKEIERGEFALLTKLVALNYKIQYWANLSSD